jgi:hypothetical protein
VLGSLGKFENGVEGTEMALKVATLLNSVLSVLE